MRRITRPPTSLSSAPDTVAWPVRIEGLGAPKPMALLPAPGPVPPPPLPRPPMLPRPIVPPPPPPTPVPRRPRPPNPLVLPRPDSPKIAIEPSEPSLRRAASRFSCSSRSRALSSASTAESAAMTLREACSTVGGGGAGSGSFSFLSSTGGIQAIGALGGAGGAGDGDCAGAGVDGVEAHAVARSATLVATRSAGADEGLERARKSRRPRRMAGASLAERDSATTLVMKLVRRVAPACVLVAACSASPSPPPAPPPAPPPPEPSAAPVASAAPPPEDPPEPRTPGRDRNGDPLPKGAIARLGTTRFRVHGARAVVGIDGERAFVVDEGDTSDGMVVRELATGTVLARITSRATHGDRNLSADATRLLVTGSGAVEVFDTKSGALIATLSLPKQTVVVRGRPVPQTPYVRSVLASRDASVVVCQADGRAYVFDGATGQLKRTLASPTFDLDLVGMTAAGDHLLVREVDRPKPRRPSASGYGIIGLLSSGGSFAGTTPRRHALWTLATGTSTALPAGDVDEPDPESLHDVNGTLVYVTRRGDAIALHDAKTRATLHTFAAPPGKGEGPVFGAMGFGAWGRRRTTATTADGRFLAVTSDDRVRVLDLVAKKQVRELAARSPSDVGLSGDGRRLAVLLASGAAMVTTADGGVDVGPDGHRGALVDVALAPGSPLVATTSGDGELRLWDGRSGKPLGSITRQRSTPAIAFSPRGDRLFAGRTDGGVLAVTLATREAAAKLGGASTATHAIAVSPDGSSLVTLHRETWEEGQPHAFVRPVSGSAPPVPLEADARSAYAAAFSADGSMIAVSDPTGVGIFHTASGGRKTQLHPPSRESPAAAFLAFTPDGRSLALGTALGPMLWDIDADEASRRFNASCAAVALSPDGKRVACVRGHGKGEIVFWETATGTPLGTLPGHGATVVKMAFSPDGATLVTASRDTTALVWDTTALTPTKPHAPKPDASGLAPALARARGLVASLGTACVVRQDGTVWCRGTELPVRGAPRRDVHAPLAEVPGLRDVVQLAGDHDFRCAVRSNGSAWCWGRNISGRLGPRTKLDAATPTAVAGLTDARQLAATGTSVCAVRTSGKVSCWGDPREGRLGRADPGEVEGIGDATAIAAGDAHTCVLRAGGKVTCWGRNDAGLLGDGTREHRDGPVDVALGGVTQLVAGRAHTCALLASGGVACWGEDGWGQLGTGRFADRRAPTRVTGIEDAVELAAFAHGTCARHRSGKVSCWGWAARWAFEHADDLGHQFDVAALAGSTSLLAGDELICGTRAAGEPVCFGDPQARAAIDGK